MAPCAAEETSKLVSSSRRFAPSIPKLRFVIPSLRSDFKLKSQDSSKKDGESISQKTCGDRFPVLFLNMFDGFVKSHLGRHSREGGSPEYSEKTGLPPARE